MKILLKTLFFNTILATVIIFAINVKAATVDETEPNDTIDTAEMITPNRQSIQEYLNGNSVNNYSERGSVSNVNEDWFKIYVDSTKDSYFSITSDPIYFQLFNSNNQAVTDVNYLSDAKVNYRVFDFSQLSNGYYYIKLTGSSTYNSYKFLFGNPRYNLDSVNRTGGIISLSTSNRTGVNEISFVQGAFPQNAQVYQIAITGVNSTYASQIILSFDKSSYTMQLTSNAVWSSFSIPLSYGYFLNGKYLFEYQYKSSAKTFTPSYTFYYVYPLLPQE